MSLLERLGVELPVVQAGMGGGLSRHELAAAVSEAGGLGTIAVNGAAAIRRELEAARDLTARPVAVNVLLPFASVRTTRILGNRPCNAFLFLRASIVHSNLVAAHFCWFHVSPFSTTTRPSNALLPALKQSSNSSVFTIALPSEVKNQHSPPKSPRLMTKPWKKKRLPSLKISK